MKKYIILLNIVILTCFCLTMHALEIYAHRGLAAYWPENTLIGFEKSIALGVDSLDIDIALTKDNIVVGSHDPFLNKNLTRDFNGKWLKNNKLKISDFTFQQLQQFDVGSIRPGSQYSLRFPKRHALDNIKIPSLQQVIKLVKSQANKNVKLQIEIKTNPKYDDDRYIKKFIKAIVDTLKANDFLTRAELQSFDWRTLIYARDIAPKVKLSFITQQSLLRNIFSFTNMPKGRSWTAGYKLEDYNNSVIEVLAAVGADNWCPYYKNVTKELVTKAHAYNIRVIPWTADTKRDMKKLIKDGVDGIITNKSDLLKQVLSES